MNQVQPPQAPVEEEEEKLDEDYPFLVQGPHLFSQSILWEQMRCFYESQGVEAWSKGIVPFFITCNAFIAKNYAKVIHSYLHDMYSNGELTYTEPVYILELGVGSGKFSFLVLKALIERLEVFYGDDVPYRVKYIMTDFCDTPFSFWREHGALKRYLNSGILDFAQFDACGDNSIHLHMSGKKLTLNSLSNPLIAIANYLFDTLPADAFCVKNGQVHRGLVSVYSKQKEENPCDPTILNRFKPKFDWVPHEHGEYPAIVDTILDWYKTHFGAREASFLIPTASLSCLERLRTFSKSNRLMVLSGDKGISNTLGFQVGDPHIAVHGSFSLMVNYHVIGLWFDAMGGFALHCPKSDASLKVSTFVLHDEVDMTTAHWNAFGDPDSRRVKRFPGLRIAFKETMSSFSPDQFFHLQQHDWAKHSNSNTNQEEEPNDENLRSVMSLLQLSDWDPDLVFKFREEILDSLSACNLRLLDDLKAGMARAWENYFLLEPDKDFAFELGRFYYGLQEYERALIFYMKSSENVGKHHVTEHNIGLCHSSLGNKVRALGFFESSLELFPTYEKALEQRDSVRRQLKLPPIGLHIGTGIDELIAAKSPLNSPKLRNSPNVRVSIDPELLRRYQKPC